jgi:hypothetical protein
VEFFAVILVLSLLVALYGALATRRQLREDWPARKVRVRTGARSMGGPFRDREQVQERVVPAGAPWLVRIASLFGHALAPVSFFITLSAWSGVASQLPSSELDPRYSTALVRGDSDWVRLLALVVLVMAFMVGLRQWRCATLILTTRYAPSLPAARWAFVGRAVLDVPPLALVLLPSIVESTSHVLPMTVMLALMLGHAGFTWAAVRASKQDYLAAEETRLQALGLLP